MTSRTPSWVSQNVPVPETKDAIAASLNRSGPLGVARSDLIERMLTAVDFDDEVFVRSDKVHDERPQRTLTAEFGSEKLSRAQTAPRSPFRFGQGEPQLAGAKHKEGMPLTPALSRRERGTLLGFHARCLSRARGAPHPVPLPP